MTVKQIETTTRLKRGYGNYKGFKIAEQVNGSVTVYYTDGVDDTLFCETIDQDGIAYSCDTMYGG